MTDTTPSDDERSAATAQRSAVRERYSQIATESGSCCDETDSCSDSDSVSSTELGYTQADSESVGAAADLNLGCGNPTALANLSGGETVLDLGSGGGFDCFLGAREIGPTGHVIGVDMTPEMIETARENIERNDTSNVEFRLGEIEHLPVADESVDVILSNCVINLSPDKPRVFDEAYRVLRPGGRLAISDVVQTAELPPDRQADPASITACISGAVPIPALDSMLTEAGFTNVSIEPNSDSDTFIREWDDERDLSDYIVAARITGDKPAGDSHLEDRDND